MNVLICGANGFIGSTLCAALKRHGHRVVKGVRYATQPDEISIDYTTDTDPEKWRARLQGIDAVVNAVGILIERGKRTFDAVHTHAPIALFEACHRAGVRCVVQISALGVQADDTPYFRSKLAADRYLQALPVSYQIVRPGLVYGINGASARLFRTLASAPVHVLPAGGRQPLRPIHVDDLAQIVARLLDTGTVERQTIDIVGADQVDYRDMLAIYRKSLGLPPALRVSVPGWAISAGAMLLNRVPGSTLTRDTWKMLQAGNTGDVAPASAILGRPPLGIREFIGADASVLRHQALATWRPWVLRGALAAVWIWTSATSLFFFPQSKSLELLAQVHLYGGMAIAALYLSATLDFIMGVATIFRPGRRLWLTQGLLTTVYSVILGLTMPHFLFDPFGPVLKNLPILAILLLLHNEETRS